MECTQCLTGSHGAGARPARSCQRHWHVRRMLGEPSDRRSLACPKLCVGRKRNAQRYRSRRRYPAWIRWPARVSGTGRVTQHRRCRTAATRRMSALSCASTACRRRSSGARAPPTVVIGKRGQRDVDLCHRHAPTPSFYGADHDRGVRRGHDRDRHGTQRGGALVPPGAADRVEDVSIGGRSRDTIRMLLDNAAIFAKIRDTLRLRIGLEDSRRPTTQARLTDPCTTFAPLDPVPAQSGYDLVETGHGPPVPQSVTPAKDSYLQNARHVPSIK